MAKTPAGEPSTRSYFVDEAGDARIFDAKGRLAAGQEGCSSFFILGALDAVDPASLSQDMDDLRAQLLADPYFRDVPSMQPDARKTALAFHAKDDIPEVRREVFSLLARHNLRFLAVVRDKRCVSEDERERRRLHPGYRYNQNDLYDSLVRRLFKNLLHKANAYDIYFARRGKSDRTAALRTALEVSQRRFREQWGITNAASIAVIPAAPPEHAGLQAVDYFLWALQRLYERGEERFVQYAWPAFRLVHDVDDTRCAKYGVYYTRKKPLTAAALRRAPGI